MTKEPIWLHREAILALHEEQILEHGGARGIRDEGLFDSAMERPRNAFGYGDPSLFDLAAAYASGIVKNHPFVDGNKRTGFIAAILFLDLNGFRLEASQAEVVETVLKLAASELTEEDFARWLEVMCVPVKG